MNKLRRCREEKGWSQAELGRRAHLHPATISQIESGHLRPYPRQLAKLARALGIPEKHSSELLFEVANPPQDRQSRRR
jgi:transcriptional regulator with XRE-family HTH domain